jgi:HEAT repeat protein
MKHAGIILVVLLCALPALSEETQLSSDILHTMTPIDTVPTKADISNIFPQNTATQLAGIAQDGNVDFGVRLRAIRALPQFCPTPCAGAIPHQTLVSLLSAVTPSEQQGSSILLTRAIIEALGVAKSGDSADVSRLTPFLDNSSRDIRAAAAFALRDLCNQAAVTPLRNRYNVEMGPNGIPQVRLAISDALRDLGTCTP